MGLFSGRPLCFGCVGAAAAAFFCAFAGVTAAVITASAALVLAVLSALFIRPREGVDRRLYFALFFSFICVVSVSSALYFSGVGRVSTGEEVFVTGYIDTTVSDGERYKATLTNLDGEPADLDVYADTAGQPPYDHVKFSAYAVLSEAEDYDAAYLKGRGIFYTAALNRVSFNGTEKNFKYYINRIRDYVGSRFYAVSGRGDLYSCLFLGRRDLAPEDVASDFRYLGVTHMLAVSGLHVMALLFGLEFVFVRAFGRRASVYMLLAFSALFYMALAGFSGSVIRASLMYFIMSSGRALGRRNDGVTGLFFSVFLIFVFCPYAVYDVGFLLSASAAAGIILVGAPAARAITRAAQDRDPLIRGLAYVGASFAVTLSVLFFTLPAAAAGYGKIIFVSLIANLAVSPFLMILLYSFPYLFIFSFVPLLGRLAGAVCDGLAEITVRVARILTALPSLSVSVRYGFVGYLVAAAAFAFLIFALAGVRRRAHYTALFAAFSAAFLCCALIFNLEFAKKDVLIVQSSGRGEVIALCSGGKCTVYDLSEGSAVYSLSDRLLEYGFTEADLVCAAPFTSYHIQSLPSVCRTVGIRRLIMPVSPGAKLCARLCGKEAEYYAQIPGETAVFECGRVKVTVTYEIYNGKTYVKADFGGTVYSEALPVYGEKTVIYGVKITDPGEAPYTAETVYLPERYGDTEMTNNKTEFYGKTAVIELK